jgi:hypothetical protein
MCCFVLFCGGEEPHVLRGEEGKTSTLVGCLERCTNRNHRHSCKHRVGLFMVSQCMSLSIDLINYFEWMYVKMFRSCALVGSLLRLENKKLFDVCDL